VGSNPWVGTHEVVPQVGRDKRNLLNPRRRGRFARQHVQGSVRSLDGLIVGKYPDYAALHGGHPPSAANPMETSPGDFAASSQHTFSVVTAIEQIAQNPPVLTPSSDRTMRRTLLAACSGSRLGECEERWVRGCGGSREPRGTKRRATS